MSMRYLKLMNKLQLLNFNIWIYMTLFRNNFYKIFLFSVKVKIQVHAKDTIIKLIINYLFAI